jgi:hypothetical protein
LFLCRLVVDIFQLLVELVDFVRFFVNFGKHWTESTIVQDGVDEYRQGDRGGDENVGRPQRAAD